MSNTTRALALIGAEVALAASIGAAGMIGMHGTAYADTGDCRYDGNHLCLPDNPQGFDAGLYDHGRLIADLTYCPSDGVWSLEWHTCGIGGSAGRQAG